MDPKKMAVAVLVTIAAAAAAIAATAHSRKVLQAERTVYPHGTLAAGEAAEVKGAKVAVDDADVAETIATLDTRGFDKRAAGPDRRFLRLTISMENVSDKPVDVKALCETLRLIQINTGKPLEAEIVWLRGYDALTPNSLPPGERTSGKIALEVSEFLLNFEFLVDIGNGAARWGVDVIDREAPVDEFM